MVRGTRAWREWLVAAAAALLLSLSASAVAEDPPPHSFEFVGPRDVVGWVHRFVFDPADPQRVFAGCDDTIGMYLSEDGGQSWRKVLAYGEGIDSWSLDIGPDGKIYAGDHFGDGIRVSSDGSQTFLLAQGEDLDYISSIDAHPATPGLAFASIGLNSDADGQGGNGPPLKDRGFIVKTTDGGLHWSKVDGGLPTDEAFKKVWVNPGDPDMMLASRSLDIWRSVDGGTTWTQIDTTSSIPLGMRYMGADDFAASPSNPDRIIATAIVADVTVLETKIDFEVWKSEDRGLSFEPTDAPRSTWLPYYDAVASPDEDLFYVFGYTDDDHGVLEARSSLGAHWQAVTSAPPHAYLGGSFIPGQSGRMLVGAFGVGAYHFDPAGGGQWTRQSKGLAGAGCLGLGLVEGEPERWIAGCGNVGLQPVLAYSDDWGASWTRVDLPRLEFHGWTDADGNIINAFLPLVSDRTMPGVVLLGGDIIQRSTDRGESWSEVAGTGRTYTLAQGAGGALYASGVSNVFRSTDHGETFSPYGLLPCPNVRVRVYPDPNTAGEVYASCEADDQGVDGFYHRADDASDWEQLADPPAPAEEHSTRLSRDPFTGYLAVVTMIDSDNASVGPPDERHFSSHVWVSSDGGATWADRTPPFECAVAQSIAHLSDQAGHLLVGGFSSDATCPGIPGRLWESFDDGVHWRDATANLAVPHAFPDALYEDPRLPGAIFLSTYYNGFYRWVVPPGPVEGLAWQSGSKTRLDWPPAENATAYDVARGDLSALLAQEEFTAAAPFSCKQQETFVTDQELPGPAAGFYYLVRAWRGPDPGSWGSRLRDDTLTACP